VTLSFRATSPRARVGRVDDWADLGPEVTIQSIGGVGKVLRILRAARIAAPRDALELVGQEDRAAELLHRALGVALRISFRQRSRLHFVAWTEDGVETVSDVAEVKELDDAYLITRIGGRFPVRFERSAVTRQRREIENWYEVLDIERV